MPYLCEREGTNCENLPETHAFLRRARKVIDDEYPGRVLRAVATNANSAYSWQCTGPGVSLGIDVTAECRTQYGYGAISAAVAGNITSGSLVTAASANADAPFAGGTSTALTWAAIGNGEISAPRFCDPSGGGADYRRAHDRGRQHDQQRQRQHQIDFHHRQDAGLFRHRRTGRRLFDERERVGD